MPQGTRRPVIAPDAEGADLWERAPRSPVRCEGCGLTAEPFEGRFCWCCWHSGQAAFVLAGATVTAADRAQMFRRR